MEKLFVFVYVAAEEGKQALNSTTNCQHYGGIELKQQQNTTPPGNAQRAVDTFNATQTRHSRFGTQCHMCSKSDGWLLLFAKSRYRLSIFSKSCHIDDDINTSNRSSSTHFHTTPHKSAQLNTTQRKSSAPHGQQLPAGLLLQLQLQ
ncbi:unnamed protein product, partial [Ceratitis capitata]